VSNSSSKAKVSRLQFSSTNPLHFLIPPTERSAQRLTPQPSSIGIGGTRGNRFPGHADYAADDLLFRRKRHGTRLRWSKESLFLFLQYIDLLHLLTTRELVYSPNPRERLRKSISYSAVGHPEQRGSLAADPQRSPEESS